MKKFIMAAFSLLAGVSFMNAQDAASIMDAARNRIKADTVSTRSNMVVTAKNGSNTERQIDQYSKDDANGNARAVIVFNSPATVAGTRFLTMDNAAGKSDQWIFLPALGKVRRIASSESGGSFMGTDFSYDDISSMKRKISLDNHTILREEALNGALCYVIQSVAKDSGYQYSKRLTWVDKSNSFIYRSEMYDKSGGLVKVMEVSNYTDIQGRFTPMQIKLSTVKAGAYTTINVTITKYDAPIPESVFTTAYLETGRAK